MVGDTQLVDMSNEPIDESSAAASIASSSNSSNNSTTDYWESVAESSVRITLAGFAGSLIGLAKERQPPPLLDSFDTTSTATTSSSSYTNNNARSSLNRLPRRPPAMPIKTASTNLPMTWSISCMLFAIVLESCRRASPTDLLFKLSLTSKDDVSNNNDDRIVESNEFRNQVMRRALTSIGDYAIGGTAAGLAGAIGQQQQRQHPFMASNRASPATRSGLVVGLGLGLLAGTLQAAIDVSSMYLEREAAMEEQRRIQERIQEDEIPVEEQHGDS